MLKNFTLTFVGTLLMTVGILAFAQAPTPAPAATVPMIPRLHQVMLQNLVGKRDLLVEKATTLKLSYEKQLADIQSQYADVGRQLDIEIKATYTETMVTPDQFDINVELGTFIPKVQVKTPAPVPDASTEVKK